MGERRGVRGHSTTGEDGYWDNCCDAIRHSRLRLGQQSPYPISIESGG